MSQKTSISSSIETDHDYKAFESMVAERVAGASKVDLFTTDAEGLFAAYLAALPEESRQHYNCHCCRHFMERFGGIVEITGHGGVMPLMWSAVATHPEFFVPAIDAMRNIVRRAKVTGVFLSSEAVFGTPITKEWSHLSGVNPNRYSGIAKTAEQAMAEKKEDYGILCRGLAEYSQSAVVQAVRVLEADAVDRSEKTLGLAKWLLALHESVADTHGSVRSNLIWRAVASAPPGWCHIKTTMIATLLDDIVLGLPFDDIQRRWNAKMHPLQYQRPTTISDGVIKQANAIVDKPRTFVRYTHDQ